MQIYKDSTRTDTATVIIFGAPQDALSGIDLPFPTINVGRINEEDKLARLFAAGDVFVAPFAEDNLPNVVLEALACGTPVAAFAAGGIPDAVEHKQNGFLAPVGNAADLGRGLAWILSDDERHARLRIGARAIAQSRFDIFACARGYKSLIAELVSR